MGLERLKPSRLKAERLKSVGTDVKKLDSSQGSAPEDVIETGNKGK